MAVSGAQPIIACSGVDHMRYMYAEWSARCTVSITRINLYALPHAKASAKRNMKTLFKCDAVSPTHIFGGPSGVHHLISTCAVSAAMNDCGG